MKSVALLMVCVIVYVSISAQSRNESQMDPVIVNFAKAVSFNKDAIPVAKNTETHFLLPQPAPGKLVNKNNNVIEEPHYTFNYDKAEKKVLVYSGEKIFITVGLPDLKLVEFKFNQTEIKCEPNSNISGDHLFEVIAKREDKYSLYRSIEDQSPAFYIITPDKKSHPVMLSHKSIDGILGNDPKAQYFLKQHKHDSPDENYLKEFVIYLNYF